MENSPELNGKYLGKITADFVKVADFLKEASHQLRYREISKYPVFVLSRTAQPIGQLLYSMTEMHLDWNYYFSFAEEFVQRNLIEQEHLPGFIATYKNPDEFCCLFVVDDGFVNFVYIPYPEDEEAEV